MQDLKNHSPEYLGRHPVEPWPDEQPPRGRWVRARYAQTTGHCPFCNAALPVVQRRVYSGTFLTSYSRSAYAEVCPVCGHDNTPFGARWLLPVIVLFSLFMGTALVVGLLVSWQAGAIIFGVGLGGLVMAAAVYCALTGYPGQAAGIALMVAGTVWAILIGQLAPLVVLGIAGVLFTGLSRSGPKQSQP